MSEFSRHIDLLSEMGSLQRENVSFVVLRIFRRDFLSVVCFERVDLFLEKLVSDSGFVPLKSEYREDLYKKVVELSSPALVYDIRCEDDANLTVFVEVVRPRIYLHIIGAGHVGQALARVAGILGYNVVLVDDRIEFLVESRFKELDVKLLNIKFDETTSVELDIGLINESSALVIVTRGHQFDEWWLEKILSKGLQPKYIGMMGSKRRVELIKRRMEEAGYSREALDGLHAPIGLSIGAVTPEEIAIAILAEIIKEFSCNK